MNNLFIFILIGLITAWSVVLTIVLGRLWVHYNALTHDIQKKDLISILNQLLKETHANEKTLTELMDKHSKLREAGKINFKHLGFKRFNPFADTGGDQSFCLSLLDENLDGFVISSLHSRENTRIYAKKITGGLCPETTLSREEQEVINQVIKR